MLVEGYKELFVEVLVGEKLFEESKYFFKEYLFILFVKIHLLAMQLGEQQLWFFLLGESRSLIEAGM